MKVENKKLSSRPLVETIINTCALALTSFGVQQILSHMVYEGYLAISFGMMLEFLKYWGRRRLW